MTFISKSSYIWPFLILFQTGGWVGGGGGREIKDKDQLSQLELKLRQSWTKLHEDWDWVGIFFRIGIRRINTVNGLEMGLKLWCGCQWRFGWRFSWISWSKVWLKLASRLRWGLGCRLGFGRRFRGHLDKDWCNV